MRVKTRARMRRRREDLVLRATAVITVFLLAACAGVGERSGDEIRPADDLTPALDEIVILFTNDMHGSLRPVRERGTDPPREIGGAPAFLTFVKSWREALGGDDGLLVLSAGDVFQGTPEGDLSSGSLVIEAMNGIGYDASTLGNHEFDQGIENVESLVEESEFPWFGENIIEAETISRPDYLSPPRIFEERGVKIGVLGLITEDLPNVTAWDTGWGILVLDPEEIAARSVSELEAEGADIIVALDHVGFWEDTRLAVRIPGIDLIIGGHSHTRVVRIDPGDTTVIVTEGRSGRDTFVIPSRTIVCQAGHAWREAGELRFRYDREADRITDLRYRLVPLHLDEYPEDPELAAELEPEYREIDERMDRPAGTAAFAILRGERGEGPASSPLGNWQTDLMRRVSDADIAIQNATGIRADIPAGTVTIRDLYTVSPFGNTVISMDLTGREVLRILERSLAGEGTPLEISGPVVYYDPGRNPYDRIANCFVGDEEIDPDRIYRVATNSFLAAGGDRYIEFTHGTERRDHGRTLLMVEIEEFESSSPVRPPADERWRRIGG